ncbi:MAG: transglutaminase [Oscillatoriophycideae cyanobacterium NC_groundwater_1537_Pr4_S-0.65um_50_18]|nr:transglutaminase [Oscillatoriophycideae cyanobacterium NC_groundwater_1537_Pr4_S-0.65um_50_18]
MLLESSSAEQQIASSALKSSYFDPQRRTIRPIGAYALRGLASDGKRLLALDSVRGHILQIDSATDNTTVLNPHDVQAFVDARGLAFWEQQIWFVKGNQVLWCSTTDFTPRLFVALPYEVDGVAVWQSTVYVTSQRAGYIMVFDRTTGKRITQFSSPGVGIENLTVNEEELWVCDDMERSVYCMDRATGEVQFSVVTPYDCPAAIAFHANASTPAASDRILYAAYAEDEYYIRDNPNDLDNSRELTSRHRTFIHPVHFHYYADRHYALSNGYLIEMSYVEEIAPLEETPTIRDLEWKIALPAETPRQKVLAVEPVGLPFTEEIQEGQRVAVFRLDKVSGNGGGLFGWKALLEVRGIKYHLTPRQVEKLPPLPDGFQERYLVDNDNLSMDTPMIRRSAREAIGTETNLLRQVLSIRNYVYDRMSYGMKPHIDTPDIALERGVGSCGEYVGILLALARLNGIACRTVGRYKCPADPDQRGVPLQPDYNHVWIEFFVPGFGWLPMESNVDDVAEGGPYPTRFFMGLPWFHAEIGKGISFEKMTAADKPDDISLGDLSINHIRFTILEELPPPT